MGQDMLTETRYFEAMLKEEKDMENGYSMEAFEAGFEVAWDEANRYKGTQISVYLRYDGEEFWTSTLYGENYYQGSGLNDVAIKINAHMRKEFEREEAIYELETWLQWKEE